MSQIVDGGKRAVFDLWNELGTADLVRQGHMTKEDCGKRSDFARSRGFDSKQQSPSSEIPRATHSHSRGSGSISIRSHSRTVPVIRCRECSAPAINTFGPAFASIDMMTWAEELEQR